MITKWEYCQFNSGFARAGSYDLNKLGEDGWELVCVEVDTMSNYIYVFKRLKQ